MSETPPTDTWFQAFSQAIKNIVTDKDEDTEPDQFITKLGGLLEKGSDEQKKLKDLLESLSPQQKKTKAR